MADTSVLNSVKKILNLPEDYKAFDQDLIMHINSTFAVLHQLGAAPKEGYYIGDESATWEDFFQEKQHANFIQTYMAMKVGLIFDPPATSFVLASREKMIQEFEWRASIMEFDFTPREVQPFFWMITSKDGFPPEAEIGHVGLDETGTIWRKT